MNQVANELDTAKVGDGVRWSVYTDVIPAYIIERTDRKIVVQDASSKLLNGFNSGEPDALQFSPGGFFGHTSGEQRYEFSPNPNGTIQTFTRRKNGRWKKSGVGMNEQGFNLYYGIGQNYDYNF